MSRTSLGVRSGCSWALIASTSFLFPSVQRTFQTIAYADSSGRRVTNTTESRRPVTVADAVDMTRFGDPLYEAGLSSKGTVAKFSPDGTRFVLVLRKGNIRRNTNEYSLLLFQTNDVFRSPKPRVLASMASSSNRPAINEVTWLADNDTILFLGERPGERTELFSVQCSSRKLHKLTNHPTNLTSFSATSTGGRIVYSAEGDESRFVNKEILRTGLHVSSEYVSDLVAGNFQGQFPDQELFAQKLGEQKPKLERIQGQIEPGEPKISLSPNGDYFVVQTEVRAVPGTWGQYNDAFLKILTSQAGLLHYRTRVYQYEVVDLRTGMSSVLLDAPIPVDLGSEVSWSPDSRSVVLSDVYLPLDVSGAAEQTIRKATRFLIEVNIPSREFEKISDEDLRLLDWDPKTNGLVCESGRMTSLAGKPVSRVYFHKIEGRWEKLAAPATTALRTLEITLEEDMNTSPRIVALDPEDSRKSLLMDLNPDFKNLAFGRVEQVEWTDTAGNKVSGGLYWPPDFVAGRKYPLVIQTHGFNPDRFSIDGPWGTAFAAQPLASKGVFVLQVNDISARWSQTPDEAPHAMVTYEEAINFLDKRNLIDRNKVGLMGFSRTCLYVAYTLTHSKYTFSAGIIADGPDAGYFQYMAFSNANPSLAIDAEALNGGAPFGDALSLWLDRSPPFLMDRVRAPLQIQALGSASLLLQWEWFTGLSRLQKPVDMLYIPHGTHTLEKPWERMVSQQGAVDWFCFWLKGEEDPDPAKAEQYERWRDLRKLQEQNPSFAPAN
jgi:hypothetical protein